MVSISPSTAFNIYADDTSIFLRENSGDEFVGEANFVLEKLNTEKNNLKINTSKTKNKVTFTQQI